MTGGPPIHVLLLHQLYVGEDEAGGTRHHEIARRLAAAGDRVTVVASPVSYLTGRPHDGPAAPPPTGMAVRRAWTRASSGEGFAGRVVSFLSFSVSSVWEGLFRVDAPDVVWGTTPPLFQALAALKVARLRGVPFVLEVRDLWPDFAVELGVLRHAWLIAWARWAERLLYRQADRVVVNSPGFVDHVASKGVARERIAVVPNGVEVEAFDPAADGAAFRAEVGIGPDEEVVMYTGAHGIPNDLDTLLDAAALLGPAARVVLVGGGRDKERARARAREEGLDHVLFVDPRPKSQMPTVVAAATVCVALLKDIPLFDTTYPNKVFDYMAAGRPTVLAIDGVIREVVEAADGGTYVPPGDAAAMAAAIRRYLADPGLAARQGASARRFVEERFHRRDQAEAMGRLLRDAAHGRAPAVSPSG